MNEQISILSIDGSDVTQHLDLQAFRKMGFRAESLHEYPQAQALAQLSEQEAIEIVASLAIKEGIKLIIINLDTAELDSIALISQLRQRASTAHMLLVATSVQTDVPRRERVLEAGADLYVLQPLPRLKFVKQIRKLLHQQSRLEERIKIAGRVEFIWENTRYQCGIANISRSGVLLATRIQFEKGTRVTMQIFLANARQPLIIEGEFVRVAMKEDAGIGVKFTSLSSQQLETLDRFIAQHASENLEMVYY